MASTPPPSTLLTALLRDVIPHAGTALVAGTLPQDAARLVRDRVRETVLVPAPAQAGDLRADVVVVAQDLTWSDSGDDDLVDFNAVWKCLRDNASEGATLVLGYRSSASLTKLLGSAGQGCSGQGATAGGAVSSRLVENGGLDLGRPGTLSSLLSLLAPLGAATAYAILPGAVASRHTLSSARPGDPVTQLITAQLGLDPSDVESVAASGCLEGLLGRWVVVVNGRAADLYLHTEQGAVTAQRSGPDTWTRGTGTLSALPSVAAIADAALISQDVHQFARLLSGVAGWVRGHGWPLAESADDPDPLIDGLAGIAPVNPDYTEFTPTVLARIADEPMHDEAAETALARALGSQAARRHRSGAPSPFPAWSSLEQDVDAWLSAAGMAGEQFTDAALSAAWHTGDASDAAPAEPAPSQQIDDDAGAREDGSSSGFGATAREAALEVKVAALESVLATAESQLSVRAERIRTLREAGLQAELDRSEAQESLDRMRSSKAWALASSARMVRHPRLLVVATATRAGRGVRALRRRAARP